MRPPQRAAARRVLVTGASYGLGAAVAARVRAGGGAVWSLSRSRPADEDAGRWVPCDLGEVDAIPAAVAALRTSTGGEPFDGVVLNAALADKSASQWTTAQVERHLRINALSPFALWEALEDQALVGAPCNVVLLGSFLQQGNVRQPAYAMSKAALWSWMRSYTMRQPAEDPVCMNMIWPGRVITPANPLRELPPGDPNLFNPPDVVAEHVHRYLTQPSSGPRGTTVDLGRS